MPRSRKLVTVGHSYVVELNRRLAHEMAAQGKSLWQVVPVAPTYFHGGKDLRPITSKANAIEPIPVELLPAHLTRIVHLFFYGSGLSALLKSADFVHCWEEPFILAGAQIAIGTPRNTPVVFTTYQNLVKRYPPPFRQFEEYSMARASGWVTGAQSVAEALGSRSTYARCPMRLIPFGADLAVFRPDPQAGANTRKFLGWEPGGPPVIGYLGRFTPEKGLGDLMAALDAVRSPWRALFVGAGVMEGQLRKWAEGHAGRVRVCSDVGHARVPQFLNAMDVLAAPSKTTPKWREQFGRMLIEAFACGLAVIGSSSGEIPHVVGDGGVVLPEGDVKAWSKKIAELIDSPDERRRLGECGLARARERFAWPVVARQHLDFFEELLEARTPEPLKR